MKGPTWEDFYAAHLAGRRRQYELDFFRDVHAQLVRIFGADNPWPVLELGCTCMICGEKILDPNTRASRSDGTVEGWRHVTCDPHNDRGLVLSADYFNWKLAVGATWETN